MFELQAAEPETGRQIISIRALPALKNHLLQEAMQLGITLSQHCENLISTTLKIKQDLAAIRLSEAEKIKEIKDLKNEIAAKSITVTGSAILSDERLLFIFSKLKGTKDRVKNAFGKDFDITYNSPEDVLKSLIYFTNLNIL